MKKIIYILFLFSFVFGCQNQKKENVVEKSVPVSVKEITKSETKDIEPIKVKNMDSTNFKNSEQFKKEIQKINTHNFQYKTNANQKIQQVLDIALLIQKENIDFDLKNHALDYAKKLFIVKEEQLLKEELKSVNLTNIDSVQVKDLILVNEQKISESKQNTTLKFNLYLFKNGKISILKKSAKLQIIKKETVLNGESYLNYKTKLIKLN